MRNSSSVRADPLQVRRFAPAADVHALETTSGRSALHKAAYWGHEQLTAVLLKECVQRERDMRVACRDV